ncbi:MAG: histidine phosphatase family protein [Thermoleophilaceae bacterium]|nr:histidine phosphatase family protein [Thermoleophilaceae bacterium]
MAVIRLIRHGQASFGLKNYDQLSELGVRQSTALGRSLKEREVEADLVICGAMKRHAQTAEATLEAMGLGPQERIDERWNEFDHEEVIVRQKPAYRSKTLMVADLARKGDPRHQFQLLFDDALARWSAGLHDDEYSESWTDFVARAQAGLQALESEDGAKNVLVFTSGGPISAVAAALLGLGSDGWMRLNRTCANCSETKIVSGRSGTTLVTWNAHTWFDVDRRLLSYR